MKKLLEFIFDGCWHKYSIVENKTYTITDNIRYRNGRTNEKEFDRKIYILKCEKCGKMIEKVFDVC